MSQLLHDRRRDGVIPAAGAGVAQLLQIRKWRVALRDREAGKAIALETKVNRAAGGQLAGVADSLSPSGRGSGVRPRKSERGETQPRAPVRGSGVRPRKSERGETQPRAPGRRVTFGRRAACGRQCHQLVARLQERLPIRASKVAQLAERPAVTDRGQDVVHLPALGVGVVDVVRDHDRQPELFGQTGSLGHEPVVVGQQVVLHLQEERG